MNVINFPKEEVSIPTMLTVRETAKRTGLSYQYLLNLCKQNAIVHIKVGNKYLINFTKFIEYLNT